MSTALRLWQEIERINTGMKPTLIIITLVLDVLFLYLLGFIGDAFLFISIFAASIILFSIFALYVLIKEKKHLIFFCLLLLFLGIWAANQIQIKHTPIKQASIEELKTLPYLTWVPAKEIHKAGVVHYDQKQAFEGINFYSSRNLSEAYLMDMSGRVLHTWSAKVYDNDSWHHIELCKNGDLLAIVKDTMLIRLDWNSRIKWTKKMRFHHDIAVDENGDIYALVRKDDVVFYNGVPIPILNEYIVVLSPDGKIKKEVSLFEILKDENPFQGGFFETYYQSLRPKTFIEKGDFLFRGAKQQDILHANTIELLNKNIEGLCKKGDMLVSFRGLDLIGIVNIEQEKLVWKWGPGSLSEQHHPTMLQTDNILIFDNGVSKKRSRILEINPFLKKIVWEYQSVPADKFYSHRRGSSQRLPNGNTLITESDSGHVFEVSKTGKIVWEFYNPQMKKERKERAAIYRMMRITDPKSIQGLDIKKPRQVQNN